MICERCGHSALSRLCVSCAALGVSEVEMRPANSRLEGLLRKIATASTYDPGETDLDDEQPVKLTITLGDVRLARGLMR